MKNVKIRYTINGTMYCISRRDVISQYKTNIFNQTVSYVMNYLQNQLFTNYNKFEALVFNEFIIYVLKNKLSSNDLVSVLFNTEEKKYLFDHNFDVLLRNLLQAKFGPDFELEKVETTNYKNLKPFNVMLSVVDPVNAYAIEFDSALLNDVYNFKETTELSVDDRDYIRRREILADMFEYLAERINDPDDKSFFIYLSLINMNFHDLVRNYKVVYANYEQEYLGRKDLLEVANNYISQQEHLTGINPAKGQIDHIWQQPLWFADKILNQNKARCVNNEYYFSYDGDHPDDDE